MLRLGFNQAWVQRVMTCVETVRYRLQVNGQLSELITPSWGPRQGDPLSSYLFLVCQEWFSANLLAMQQVKRIEGIRLAPGLQRINHLLFADDCILFIKWELRQLKDLKHLLCHYEELVGQRVNQDKSDFLCSSNLEDIMQSVFAQFLGMRVVQAHSKYLGIPAIISQNRTTTFKEVEERAAKKIQDWNILCYLGRAEMFSQSLFAGAAALRHELLQAPEDSVWKTECGYDSIMTEWKEER